MVRARPLARPLQHAGSADAKLPFRAPAAAELDRRGHPHATEEGPGAVRLPGPPEFLAWHLLLGLSLALSGFSRVYLLWLAWIRFVRVSVDSGSSAPHVCACLRLNLLSAQGSIVSRCLSRALSPSLAVSVFHTGRLHSLACTFGQRRQCPSQAPCFKLFVVACRVARLNEA